jgi:hypothetical protein
VAQPREVHRIPRGRHEFQSTRFRYTVRSWAENRDLRRPNSSMPTQPVGIRRDWREPCCYQKQESNARNALRNVASS